MTDLQEIFDYVDQHQAEFLADLKEICACRSVADDREGLVTAKNYVLDKMSQIGIDRREVSVTAGNAMVYGHCAGEKEQTVLFYNHYDVVEEGHREAWKTENPYDLTRIADVLYGRGVSDDKGPLLSRLHAVQAILQTKGTLPVHVKFLVEGDEETGSPSMFRYQEEYPEVFREMVKADLCFWENGRRDQEGRPWARFGVRGACSFNLKVTTGHTDVHGRMGVAVPSASWRLIWALNSLKGADERISIDGFYDDVISPTEKELEILEKFPYEEEQTKANLGIKEYLLGATGDELKERIYLEPTLSVCGVEAGELYNGPRGIVPHTAWARISFYLVAAQDPDKINSQLREHLDRNGFKDVEVEYIGGTHPVKTSPELPVKQQLERAAERVYDQPMIVELTQLGSGPAIAFRRAWPEIPIVGIGPGNTNGKHHAPNENLVIDDYIKAIKHVIAFLYEFE